MRVGGQGLNLAMMVLCHFARVVPVSPAEPISTTGKKIAEPTAVGVRAGTGWLRGTMSGHVGGGKHVFYNAILVSLKLLWVSTEFGPVAGYIDGRTIYHCKAVWL